ncbi:zinc finger protein 83-like [Toxorhynchites rutilus septentrionalis]|uniref:zinc finger protein 83-like n=1 Tax=Toxorhynchites rutilus septentrionalis TaxID=329112 RepID=UPI00247A7EC6|nr:zinc finger protein 83-like [Toxorhynchites rutilus septentrionalis]
MNLSKICRMCLSEKSRVKSIFKDYQREGLLSIITDVVQLDVQESDGFPPNICKPCATTLIRMQENLNEFRENERVLRRQVEYQPAEVTDETGDGRTEAASQQLVTELSLVEEHLQEFIKQELSSDFNDLTVLPSPNVGEDNLHISTSEQHHRLSAAVAPEVFADALLVKEHTASENETFEDGDGAAEQASSAADSSSEGSPEEEVYSKRKSKAIRPARKRRTARRSSHQDENQVKRKYFRKTDDDGKRPKINDHKCYICRSESLGSAKALLEHLTIHLDRTPHTCTECKMETVVLKSVRSLNVHMKMHAQPMKCEYCDRRYCDDRARDYHVKTFHLGESAPCPSTCEQCGKVCKSLSALKSHMRDHRLNLKCEHCDKVFHRRNKLKEHVTRVHEKAEKYECNLCHRVVHSLESYNSHLKMHMSEKTYECDLCPMKFYTAGNLGLHKKIHSGNANYKPHKDWSGHYTVTQEPGQDKIYTCKLCGKTYTKTVMKINNHLKNHFKEVKCDRCDLKFVNESQLKTHYVVHTGIRQHKCESCGKDFLHKNNLTQHLKLHRNEQNFACEFCGKLFTYKEGMKAHIRNHHLRESPYECVPCRRKFVDSASLVRHNVAEHDPPPLPVDLGPPPLMGTVQQAQMVKQEQLGVGATS